MTPGIADMLRTIAARLPLDHEVDPATAPLTELAAEVLSLRSCAALRRPVAGWLGLYRRTAGPTLAARFEAT